jgi:hypothetical protein
MACLPNAYRPACLMACLPNAYRPACLTACPPNGLPVHLPIVICISMFDHLSIRLFLHAHLPECLVIYISVSALLFSWLFVCLPCLICPSVYPTVHVYVCQAVNLSIRPSYCPSVCLSVSKSIFLLVSQSASPIAICHVPVCLSVCLSVRLFICLSVQYSISPMVHLYMSFYCWSVYTIFEAVMSLSVLLSNCSSDQCLHFRLFCLPDSTSICPPVYSLSVHLFIWLYVCIPQSFPSSNCPCKCLGNYTWS